jgi:LysM repeat protein
VTRARLAHYGGPAALLLAVTVAVLLVRGALSSHAPAPVRDATTATKPVAPPARAKPRPAVVYRVGAGDTLGAIAARYRTTVDRLLELNPGVEPTSLRVGQKVRVK